MVKQMVDVYDIDPRSPSSETIESVLNEVDEARASFFYACSAYFGDNVGDHQAQDAVVETIDEYGTMLGEAIIAIADEQRADNGDNQGHKARLIHSLIQQDRSTLEARFPNYFIQKGAPKRTDKDTAHLVIVTALQAYLYEGGSDITFAQTLLEEPLNDALFVKTCVFDELHDSKKYRALRAGRTALHEATKVGKIVAISALTIAAWERYRQHTAVASKATYR